MRNYFDKRVAIPRENSEKAKFIQRTKHNFRMAFQNQMGTTTKITKIPKGRKSFWIIVHCIANNLATQCYFVFSNL